MEKNTGSHINLSRFYLPPEHPEARRTRIQSRQRELKKKTFSDTMRWALHLADSEHAGLVALNPETLGHDDQQLANKYWKQFIESPESNVFKMRVDL